MVGLDGSEADPALPCQVVSTGVPQVVACVRDASALRRVLPAYDRIGRLLADHDAIVLYLAAVDPEAGTAHARSFMRSAEMGEDPATGSAVGPLCAHVAARTGTQRIEVDQGAEMGRPSRLVAEVDGDRVRVGGEVVVVAEGTVHLLDT